MPTIEIQRTATLTLDFERITRDVIPDDYRLVAVDDRTFVAFCESCGVAICEGDGHYDDGEDCILCMSCVNDLRNSTSDVAEAELFSPGDN